MDHTVFGLRCTITGQLALTAWTPGNCDADFERATNATTASFCTMAVNHTLVCNISASSGVISINRTSLLAPLMASRTCNTPTTTAIPLLPNPVTPQAMTAIVVCVCLFIVCILAGFFFWPKCHLSQAAVTAAAKEIKDAKNAKVTENARGRSVGGGVSYNASQNTVTLGGGANLASTSSAA